MWNWSGSSGNPITITVDKTWYNATACPSAWNRPIWDAGKATISGANIFFRMANSGSTSYGVLDSIEMKGLYCAGACSYGTLSYVQGYNPAPNWTLSNLYIHGWNVVTDGSCYAIQPSLSSTGTTLTTSVIDGSDATGASPAGATCYALYHDLINITNNVMHDLANGIVAGATADGTFTISGNLIYNINTNSAGSHPNAIETISGGTYYIHDNVIHDINALGAEVMMIGNTGETDYIWNNVIYNVSVANNPTAPQNRGQTGMTIVAWNNTIVGSTSYPTPCFFWGGGFGGTFTAVTIENNHCITSSGAAATSSWNGTAAAISGNVVMTPATALADGYTSSQKYAYSPTSPSLPTVGAGNNYAGSCSGPLSGLCSDTASAVAYNSTAQTITVPGRSSALRPFSGSWDAGAYNFPQPPTNLQSVVH